MSTTNKPRRFLQIGLLLFGVLAGLAVFAWTQRVEILLQLVEIRQRRALDLGPTPDLVWDSGADPQGRAPDERPPNIVVILADDLGWNDLSWLGGGVAGGTVPTPNIDSLARDGIDFRNGYSANGTCAPSRAALLSGRYGTRFGFEFTPTPPGFAPMVGMIGDLRKGRLRKSIPAVDVESAPGADLEYESQGLPASEITLAELLDGAGYHSVHIGKWHVGRTNGMAALDQGFDESLLMASGLYLPEDSPEVVNSKQDFDPIDQFLWRAMNFAASWNDGQPFEPEGYITDWYTDQAVKVIEANKDRPFFLYMAHWAVHTPLQALRADYEALSHIEDHRMRVYAAMVRSLDRSVGRILQALRDQGLEDNTLVVFTSDNGGPGYIGLPEVNAPFRGWKISFFEGGIHVPYLMKWPARLPAGTVYEQPVHGFDLFATAAAAAGVPLPTDRPIDGVDLVPYVLGEREGSPHDALFWRTGPYEVVRAGDWKLQTSWQAPDGRTRTWLFDLANDPTEQIDLSAQHPDKVAELRALIDRHNESQVPPAWPSMGQSPINIDKTLVEADAPDDEYIYWAN